MHLPKQEKIDAVEEIKSRIRDNEIAVMTRYVGINVAKVTELRKRLRDENIRFKVYKNTLAKRALDELGLSEAASFMDGPTGWAFSNDPVAPARLLSAFVKESDRVAMSGGILDGKIVTAAQLEGLAKLPSKDQLLAQVVGTIAAPLRNLVGALSALPRNLVSVLDEIRKQKEEPQAAQTAVEA